MLQSDFPYCSHYTLSPYIYKNFQLKNFTHVNFLEANKYKLIQDLAVDLHPIDITLEIFSPV
jgi:hypothetical protein